MLDRARALGLLGPGSLETHVDQALAFAALAVAPLAARPLPGRLLDLGSGAGVPGLPLLLSLPAAEVTLLDGKLQRAEFLRWAIEELGLGPRARVIAARAEDAARGPLRGSFDVVTARGFGPAAVTAECAAPFLGLGGHLIVSEPPGSNGLRWPPDGLSALGLELVGVVARPFALAVLRAGAPCPDRFPRRVGIPAKRPLF